MSLSWLKAAVKRRLSKPDFSLIYCPSVDADIERSLRSMLNQPVKNIEILVVLPEPSACQEENQQHRILEQLAARDRRIRKVPATISSVRQLLRLAHGRSIIGIHGSQALRANALTKIHPGSPSVHGCISTNIHTAGHTPLVAGLSKPLESLTICAPKNDWLSASRIPTLGKELRFSFCLQAVSIALSWQHPTSPVHPSITARSTLSHVKKSNSVYLGCSEYATLMSIEKTMRSSSHPNASSFHTWLLNEFAIALARSCATIPPQERAPITKVLRQSLPKIEDREWGAIRFEHRVLLWQAAWGTQDDFEDALVLDSKREILRRFENMPNGNLQSATRAPVQCLSALPEELLHVFQADLNLRCGIITSSMNSAGQWAVRGYVYMPGLINPSTNLWRATLVTPDSNSTADITAGISWVEDPMVDVIAGERWVSHACTAFELTLPLASRNAQIHWTASVAGHQLSATMPVDPSSRLSGGAVTQRPRITRICVDRGVVRVSGCARPAGMEGMALVSHGKAIELPLRTAGSDWEIEVSPSDLAIANGAHYLQYQAHDGTLYRTFDLDLGIEIPLEIAGLARGVRVVHSDTGECRFSFFTPLSPSARSRFAEQKLIDAEFGPLKRAYFFESFRGKSGWDNPGALCEKLLEDAPMYPMYFSVENLAVDIPSGAIAVVRGSKDWFRALRTARVVITNDNFPSWYRKQPGQFLMQTWHGTPIKKLLHDAHYGAVSLDYRRLMEIQANEWDVFLAQSSEAEKNLRSALRFSCPTFVEEYPRNWRLLESSGQLREAIRSKLGVSTEDFLVLYAPTWRESLRAPSMAANQGFPLDVEQLIVETGCRVMVRNHHMNKVPVPPAALDVSLYPRVEDLLIAADCLITDYSSIVFDFEITGKPAYIFQPSSDAYTVEERETLVKANKPRAIPVTTIQQMLDQIGRIQAEK